MSNLVYKRTLFSVVFLSLLAIDIFAKLTFETNGLRYISKPLVLLSLFIYYLRNHSEADTKDYRFMIIGMLCFLIGDLAFINEGSTIFLITGIILFTFGKLFYSFRLSHNGELNIPALSVFLLVIFFYVLFIFNLIYNNLGVYLLPVALYMFLSMLLAMMAFLRYRHVDRISYIMVMSGVLFFIASESITALKLFYTDIFMQDFFIMLFYGLAQFFIITGLIWRIKSNVNDIRIN